MFIVYSSICKGFHINISYNEYCIKEWRENVMAAVMANLVAAVEFIKNFFQMIMNFFAELFSA